MTGSSYQSGQRSDLRLRRLDSFTSLIQGAAPPRQSAQGFSQSLIGLVGSRTSAPTAANITTQHRVANSRSIFGCAVDQGVKIQSQVRPLSRVGDAADHLALRRSD
jgi:hypothetical protein